MIGIVNYQAGNAPSVLHAMNRIGAPAKLVERPDELTGLRALILPGVGSARATMDSLAASGLVDALNHAVLQAKMPFLGICVGLQILFEYSAEADTPCLGWLPGRVVRFDSGQARVPQMGWNQLAFVREHALTLPAGQPAYVYFVNSYYAVPADPADVIAQAHYAGVDFCALAGRGHIFGSQFHMEKSGEIGLAMLRRFVTLVGEPLHARTADIGSATKEKENTSC